MRNKQEFTIDVVSKIDDEIVDYNLSKRFMLWFNRAKPKKNRWIPFVASAAALILIITSVFLFLPDGKQVPIYQGMTVSNEAPIPETSADFVGSKNMALMHTLPTLSISPMHMFDSDAPHKGNNKKDPPVISGGPYYAQPNEDIYIYVHISNPDGFEILSFTLNGVKYSTYMFEAGSDLETLILKYNVGANEGVQQYTIDAIKYVDGEKIKDVRMEGERTIEVLVGNDAQNVTFNESFNGWDLVIDPKWDDSFTGEKKFLSLGVYDGETLLQELDPEAKIIKNLPMDKRLLLVATYLDNENTLTAKAVIQTPKQSEGLIVVNGLISGIGSCTDTVLYINMPIDDEAFKENKQITKVYLGSGVTSIDARAFVNCSNLTSVMIGDNVTSIGESAFRECSRLTNITISDGVTSIGEHAFEYCSGLINVEIGNNVTSIGDSAFEHCSKLESITIPDNLIIIGRDAFMYCSRLKNIEIGDKLTSIGEQAFINTAYYSDQSNWTNGVLYINNHLIKATRPETSYDIRPGTLTIAEGAFRDCAALQSVTIPNGVTSISGYAFSNCSSLKSVTIPDSVTSIGESAFRHCNTLESITLPDNVTSIGKGAFSYCSSLKSVTIPDGVTTLYDGVFVCCSNLTTVTMPDTVKSIELSVFCQCPKLETIIYAGTQESWRAINKSAFYKDTDQNFTVRCSDGDITE